MTVDIGLGNWFYRRAVRTPLRKALTFEGTTWTYGELQDRIDRLANALRTYGVCRGDRVGFLGFNQPALLETLFAAARLGAIFVPLNFRLTGPELSYIINNAGVHTLVADIPHRPMIDSIRPELPCRRYFSADQPDEEWPDIAGLLATHDPIRTGERVAEDEIALIMFNAGTEIHFHASSRDRNCPEQPDRRELAWVQLVDLCAARTGQVHLQSNERKSAGMFLPVRSHEGTRHEPHVGAVEREVLSCAGLDVGPRHVAIDPCSADRTIEVTDRGVLCARTAKHVIGAARTEGSPRGATLDRNGRERPR
jgi:hypothetical protein